MTLILKYLIIFSLLMSFANANTSKSFNKKNKIETPITRNKHNPKSKLALKEKDLYLYGMQLMMKNKYSKSTDAFTNYYLDNPLSEHGFNAMVMEAYCLYKQKKYLSTINAVNDIALIREDMKDNENFLYAQYIKILAQVNSHLSCEHCIENTYSAQSLCKEFIDQYPNTIYAQNIQNHLLSLINKRILEKEMHVGRICLKQNNPTGAIKRFLKVLNDKNSSFFDKEALYRILEGYAQLGLYTHAIDRFYKYENNVFSQLNKQEKNKDIWYKKSYELICVLKNKK